MPLTAATIQAISSNCNIHVLRYEQVIGGDINECYCLHTTDGAYFLKLQEAARFPDLFDREAEGLRALGNSQVLLVPEIIERGIEGDKQWLLLQWLEKASPQKESIQHFGAALAAMHRQTQPFFGWHNNNYIGTLQQVNQSGNSWTDFYTQCRIMPLVKRLVDDGSFSGKAVATAELFCKHAADLFPAEPAALLHGDLWGGNYMIVTGGKVAVFDPAVYCGHREMDLGMTRLFGGFPPAFYQAYEEAYPLQKNWEERLPLTQLYPVLVHAALFGGHYISHALEIMGTLGSRNNESG